MVPSEWNFELRRGSTFVKELVCQNKVYLFATSLEYTSVTDIYRSHAENLEKYGFSYEYIDFLSVYDKAELMVRKPWVVQGDEDIPALLTLSMENGGIELTNKSVKLFVSAQDTAALDFNGGAYGLELTRTGAEADGTDIVDKLVFGSMNVVGELVV